MGIEKILKSASILFAFVLFSVCIMLWGEIKGFEQGMLAASGIEDWESITQNFSVSGPNFFESVIEKYILLAVFFCVYLYGKIAVKSLLTHYISFTSLGIIIFLYWRLLQFKYGIDETAVLFYRKWLTKSISLDWVCLLMTMVLIVFQVASLASIYLKNKIPTTDNNEQLGISG